MTIQEIGNVLQERNDNDKLQALVNALPNHIKTATETAKQSSDEPLLKILADFHRQEYSEEQNSELTFLLRCMALEQ